MVRTLNGKLVCSCRAGDHEHDCWAIQRVRAKLQLGIPLQEFVYKPSINFQKITEDAWKSIEERK